MQTNNTTSPLLEFLTANPYWPLKAGVLANLCMVFERHLNGVRLTGDEISAIAAGGKMAAKVDYEVIDGVAVIPVTGVIAKYSRQVNGTSQAKGTSVEQMQHHLTDALADPGVQAILLDIESPGGNIAGLADLADAIYAACDTKPIVAHANDMAASAAYWIGCQADEFYANQSAEVGSIGVYTYLIDSSKAYESEGLRVIPVTSGANKGVGMPGVAISNAQVEPFRKTVSDYYDMFTAAVLRGRRKSGIMEDALANVADGRVMVAAAAVDARLIDGIRTFDQSLQRARDLAANPGPNNVRQPRQSAMPVTQKPAQATVIEDPATIAAKAQAYDDLKASGSRQINDLNRQIAALTTENRTLAALLAARGVSAGGHHLPQAVANQPAQPDAQTATAYNSRVKSLTASGKATLGQAYAQAAHEMPASHQAWVAAGCPAIQ